MNKKVIRGIKVRGTRGRWNFDLIDAHSGRTLLEGCNSTWDNSHRLVDGEHYYTVHCQDAPALAAQMRTDRKPFPVVVIVPTDETKDAERHDYDHPVNILVVEPTGHVASNCPDRADALEVRAFAQLSSNDFEGA